MLMAVGGQLRRQTFLWFWTKRIQRSKFIGQFALIKNFALQENCWDKHRLEKYRSLRRIPSPDFSERIKTKEVSNVLEAGDFISATSAPRSQCFGCLTATKRRSNCASLDPTKPAARRRRLKKAVSMRSRRHNGRSSH